MYVKVKDGQVAQYPYTFEDLRNDNPKTSFNMNTPESVFERYGAYLVHQEKTPIFNSNTHRIKVSDVPVLKEGKWVLEKTIVDLDDVAKQLKMLERAEKIKMECRRRILSVASETAQGNIAQAGVIYTAMRVNGVPETEALDMSGFKEGDLSIAASFQVWRSHMVRQIETLASDMSLNYNDDSNWPPIPEGVEDLAMRF
jgi:hypothetical protein